MFKGSWKTTVTGIGMVCAGLAQLIQPLVDNDPATTPNFELCIGMVTGGIGLIFARDNNKSSEDVQAK